MLSVAIIHDQKSVIVTKIRVKSVSGNRSIWIQNEVGRNLIGFRRRFMVEIESKYTYVPSIEWTFSSWTSIFISNTWPIRRKLPDVYTVGMELENSPLVRLPDGSVFEGEVADYHCCLLMTKPRSNSISGSLSLFPTKSGLDFDVDLPSKVESINAEVYTGRSCLQPWCIYDTTGNFTTC